MESNTLIRKVHMSCPLCNKAHEIEERKRTTSIILKGEEVTYEERFYFCANADENENEFETGAMTNENLLMQGMHTGLRWDFSLPMRLLPLEKAMGSLRLILPNCLDGEKQQYLAMKVKEFKMRLMTRCFD